MIAELCNGWGDADESVSHMGFVIFCVLRTWRCFYIDRTRGMRGGVAVDPFLFSEKKVVRWAATQIGWSAFCHNYKERLFMHYSANVLLDFCSI